MSSRSFKVGVEVEGTFLTPVRLAERPRDAYTGTFYLFKCRCGNKKVIRKNNVKSTYHGTNRKGLTPWNKGMKGMDPLVKGHPNLSWKKGKVKLTYPNGKIAWVKVSDEAIGSQSKFYERPTRQKRQS